MAWRNRELKHRIYWELFERKVIADATALHTTCEMERRETLSQKVGVGQKFIVVPNGIKTSDYKRSENVAISFRKAMGLSSEQKIILSFATRWL